MGLTLYFRRTLEAIRRVDAGTGVAMTEPWMRCWKCHRFEYMDTSCEGGIVDDAWMCGYCIGLMDGKYKSK